MSVPRPAPLRAAFAAPPVPPATTDDRLAAFIRAVEGRRVVLVGNSVSLFDQWLGERIDSYDLVVRMNLGFVRAPQHQGSRCDIVLTSSERLGAEQIVSCYRPDWVMWATPRRDKMPDLTPLADRLVLHPLTAWDELQRRVAPARPSTGLIGLNFFARHCRCAELAFAGYDFFDSGTFYHRRFLGLLKPRRKASTAHDGAAEAHVVAELIAAGRVRRLAPVR